MYEVALFKECCGTVSTTLSLQNSQFPDNIAVVRNNVITWCMIRYIDGDSEVNCIIEYCLENNLNTPVEITRALQLFLVQGRPLEIPDVNMCPESEAKFILVNKNNLLIFAFDQTKS